ERLNEFLTERLSGLCPDAAVVAEETVASEGPPSEASMARRRVFFVDPIDGTREFVDKSGDFAVMVGMTLDGEPHLGVIGWPTRHTVYVGMAGVGSFAQQNGARTRFAVSATDTFGRAKIVVSRSHLPPMVEPLRRRLGAPPAARRGSAGVKALLVATGEADFYPHDGPGMKLWDVCGPQAIVEAAGGRLTDLEGGRVDYRGGLALERGLLFSNRQLHPGVLSAVDYARRRARAPRIGGG
ncbi:MAG: inositol monophosphatase family protein, partial [Myxococcota bacterium]